MGDEDDYMSDAFLAGCSDVRPGLLDSKANKKVAKEKQRKVTEAKSRTIPRHQLERETREQGLNSALGTENKGFLMLQKMGFKPGMTMGKTGGGRAEPVPINFKAGRTGLGHDTEKIRKRTAAVSMQAARHKRRLIEVDQLRQHFKSRVIDQQNQRQTLRDLNKSQKACEQLDSAASIKEPEQLFFWPKAFRPAQKPEEKEDSEEEEEDENKEQDEDDAEDEDALERLQLLTCYLRTTHLYCIWCGTAYSDKEDLQANCPGDTAEVHDE